MPRYAFIKPTELGYQARVVQGVKQECLQRAESDFAPTYEVDILYLPWSAPQPQWMGKGFYSTSCVQYVDGDKRIIWTSTKQNSRRNVESGCLDGLVFQLSKRCSKVFLRSKNRKEWEEL